VSSDRVALLGAVERCRHGVVHGAGEGVLLVGPQNADDLHAVVDLDLDLLGHVVSSLAWLAIGHFSSTSPTLHPMPSRGTSAEKPVPLQLPFTDKRKHRLEMTPEGQCNHDLALSLSKGGRRAPSVLRPREQVRGQASSARDWRTRQAKTALSAALGRFCGSAVL